MKTVIIQKQLLHELEVAIKSHNQNSKPKLKIDVSVYFISLFNSIPSFYREDKRNTYYVNLNSKLLKKASSKYLNYLNFFLRNGYIEKVANYSTDRGESNSFRLNESYLKDEITIYHLSDKVLLKALSKVDDFQKVREKNLLCEEKRLHLTKYFNDNLKINSEEAFIELKLLFPEKSRKFIIECQFKVPKLSINI